MDNPGQNPQNVISMSDHQPDSGFAAIAQVEAYWEALRGDRLLPKRADIDPRGIERALEYAFILERIAPGVARLRVAGSHLSDLMGMEVRGMPLTAFFAPGARRQVADGLEEVFQTPATSLLHLHSPGAIGRKALEARMLILPLKSDLGDVSRALGCLVSSGEMGNAPRRFDIARHDIRPLQPGAGPALVPRGPQPLPSRPAPAPGFAEGATGFEGPAPGAGAKGKAKRPPYLRLIKSDD
jgi:hypothetical protein